MQMNNSDQLLTRAEKEQARKCAKRARESSVERSRRKEGNRLQKNVVELLSLRLNNYNVLLLVSRERLIVELLSQKQSVYSILLLVSSERLIVELLSQKQSVYSILLLVSSGMPVVELQELEHRLNSNQEHIATYRENATVEERLERQQNDRINATQRRNAARQSAYDSNRHAIDKFRQDIYTGLF